MPISAHSHPRRDVRYPPQISSTAKRLQPSARASKSLTFFKFNAALHRKNCQNSRAYFPYLRKRDAGRRAFRPLARRHVYNRSYPVRSIADAGGLQLTAIGRLADTRKRRASIGQANGTIWVWRTIGWEHVVARARGDQGGSGSTAIVRVPRNHGAGDPKSLRIRGDDDRNRRCLVTGLGVRIYVRNFAETGREPRRGLRHRPESAL